MEKPMTSITESIMAALALGFVSSAALAATPEDHACSCNHQAGKETACEHHQVGDEVDHQAASAHAGHACHHTEGEAGGTHACGEAHQYGCSSMEGQGEEKRACHHKAP